MYWRIVLRNWETCKFHCGQYNDPCSAIKAFAKAKSIPESWVIVARVVTSTPESITETLVDDLNSIRNVTNGEVGYLAVEDGMVREVYHEDGSTHRFQLSHNHAKTRCMLLRARICQEAIRKSRTPA